MIEDPKVRVYRSVGGYWAAWCPICGGAISRGERWRRVLDDAIHHSMLIPFITLSQLHSAWVGDLRMHDDTWYPIVQTDTATLSLRRFETGDVALQIEDLGPTSTILLDRDQGQELSAELALATYPRKGATP